MLEPNAGLQLLEIGIVWVPERTCMLATANIHLASMHGKEPQERLEARAGNALIGQVGLSGHEGEFLLLKT